MKKRIKILISACGGGIGPDVGRSLKLSNLKPCVIGMDTSEKGMMFGSVICDKVIVGPKVNDENYREMVNDICSSYGIDAIIFNHSRELKEIGKREMSFDAPCLLPSPKAISICSDKWNMVKAFLDAGLSEMVATTSIVKSEKIIKEAFKSLGSPLWMRLSDGSGGRGSLFAEKPEHAVSWMRYWKEIMGENGQWLLHEYLPGRNYNWSSVWYNGQLIVSACMERVEYYMARFSISGISGNIAEAKTVKDKRIDEICTRAIGELFPSCHGIFTIDLKEDKRGVPKITEIENRLQGRTWLSTVAGVNFPETIVRLLLKLPRDYATTLVEGATLYRSMDFEPLVKYPNEEQKLKRIAFIPTIFKSLRSVLTDRFAIFFKRIEEKFGFKIVFCDSIGQIPDDLETVLVFAGPHGKQLMLDMTSIPTQIKVIMYLSGSHCFPHTNKIIINALERCDKVICGEFQSFEERWSQYLDKFIFFPSCFAPHERYAGLKYNESPVMKCLFSGCNKAKHYPMRHYLKGQIFGDSELQKLVDTIRHPRWVKIDPDTEEPRPLNEWEIEVPMGDAYAKCLNKYFCSIATSSTHNYAVAKYFEIPAVGTLLLANITPDVEKTGLIAGKHYVPITQKNIVSQIKDCLNKPEKYEEIRRNGMEYVRKNHSVNNRIEQFKEILEKIE